MAKEICVLCRKKVTVEEGRSRHLKKVHGIDPFPGAVARYFEEEDCP